MITATLIYNLGDFVSTDNDAENADKLGLQLLDYQSRRDMLVEFLSVGLAYSEQAYIQWLIQHNAREKNSVQQYQQGWTVDMPSRGFGDMVAKITNRVGIKPCSGCKRRQAALNRKFPSKRMKK